MHGVTKRWSFLVHGMAFPNAGRVHGVAAAPIHEQVGNYDLCEHVFAFWACFNIFLLFIHVFRRNNSLNL